MDTNNWSLTAQGGGEPAVDTGDWRATLQPDSRQRIVNKIMETLKRHLPFSGQEGLEELKKIAVRFEEKIYMAATSQSDYVRKISLKMLTMESKSQNPMPNSLPNSSGNNNRPPDSGASQCVPPQVLNQGQSLPMPMTANQSQTRQQLLAHNIQNNIASTGVQSSSGLTSAVPGLTQTSIPNVSQNPNMQNISGVPQTSVGDSLGKGVPSNMYAISQRQMPGRQQVVPQQQQQQSQTHQYMFQQQFNQQHQQLMKQKFQQGNVPHPLVQSYIHQQQPNLLQLSQLQSSQQSSMQTSSVMHPSMMQSTPLSGLQQNQPSIQQSVQSTLQQHPKSVLRQPQQPQQASGIHQQQTLMMQQSLLPQQQQQQQQMVQQQNATNMLQNQLIGQQNSVGDMQQQQQRLMGQQNNHQNLQQHQQQQQQLIAQQNNLSCMHQQQLGSQSNVSKLQQQLLGTQPGNPSMQINQHSMHRLQQTQQNASNLLPTPGQHPPPQMSQQQMMSQIQSLPQLQQLALQQQSNTLQRDLQPGLQAPATLLQQQNVIDPQRQLYQSQRPLPETSSTSLDSTAQTGLANGGDWQEEVYQKIKVMKDMYFPELNEMYQKIATKLQQHYSLPQPKTDQLEKLKLFKSMLERIIAFLHVPKSNIAPGFKEKLGSYEKQIINFINTNRPKKTIPSMQGQLPQPRLQQAQSQVPQVQCHENQMNPQMQSIMQQKNMSSLQQNSPSSLSGVATSQQNMMNSLQPASNVDSGQGNALSSLQQPGFGSQQQNPVSTSQQANISNLSSQSGATLSNLSSQSGVTMLQPNIPLQSNPNMLQHQQMKQQQEQHMMQNPQLKQLYQQRQMQQQLMQKQQMLQQQEKCVYIPATIGWILATMALILCCVFLTVHNVVGDACFVIDEWVQNPTAHTALDDILPCVDQASSQQILPKSKDIAFQLVTTVNSFITNVANNDPPNKLPPDAKVFYYNQSGPLMPVLCNHPFDSDMTTDQKCAAGEVDFDNASQEWSKYICQVSADGNCNTTGRLTPEFYNQMICAVNVSYALDGDGPFVANLVDCTFVRETFRGIIDHHCPGLNRCSGGSLLGL